MPGEQSGSMKLRWWVKVAGESKLFGFESRDDARFFAPAKRATRRWRNAVQIFRAEYIQ
jgi:hypothetical protein